MYDGREKINEVNYGEVSDGEQKHALQIGFCCRPSSPQYRLCIYARALQINRSVEALSAWVRAALYL
jgi:hypothetical protein